MSGTQKEKQTGYYTPVHEPVALKRWKLEFIQNHNLTKILEKLSKYE